MVRLYMDESVRGSITRRLRQRDVDLVTTHEDGRTGAPDPEILDRATALDRVLFSEDADLLVEATRRQRAGEFFAGVVYAHPRHVPVGVCVTNLELIAKVGDSPEFRDCVQFLPL